MEERRAGTSESLAMTTCLPLPRWSRRLPLSGQTLPGWGEGAEHGAAAHRGRAGRRSGAVHKVYQEEFSGHDQEKDVLQSDRWLDRGSIDKYFNDIFYRGNLST